MDDETRPDPLGLGIAKAVEEAVGKPFDDKAATRGLFAKPKPEPLDEAGGCYWCHVKGGHTDNCRREPLPETFGP